MSDPDPGWDDAFAKEDPTAAERARRRAEREARRGATREGLGKRVSDGLAGAPPPSAKDPPPAPPEDPARPLPATDEPRSARPARAGTPGGIDPVALRARRLIGLVLVLGVVGLLIFGVVTVADRVGNDDAPLPPPKVSELTIPEGYDRSQVAELARKQGLRGDYERASRSFKGFDPAKYGAEDSESLEGFLFPALYELPRKATVEDLISRQLDAFRENIREVDMGYAESKNLTVYDVLIIASMVEREVQVEKERRLVAAVIYNRLAADMPLGIDATIRFEDQNYDEQLLESRLNEDTPYNTRINSGLPPGPIGNPGLASIEAAANPAKEDYLYFVVKPDTCGEHVFTASAAEFSRAEAAYQQALAEQGGSPTDCG